MILGSHNSWSYLPVRKWWMKPIAWMARCQSFDIKKQYEIGVRCFDLRIRVDKDGALLVAHGCVVYDIGLFKLMGMLSYLNRRGDVMVRVLHEVRKGSMHTEHAKWLFADNCRYFEEQYPNIRFWCGRNLVDWKKDYDFGDDPYSDEKYGSVSDCKWLYGWWPWLYAIIHNRKNLKEGSDGILLIDYVNVK